MKRRIICRLSYILSLFVICSVAGCTKIYHGTVLKPGGEVVLRADFESGPGGNHKYDLEAEWYESGALKSVKLIFERDIATPMGKVTEGIAESLGAAGNHLGI